MGSVPNFVGYNCLRESKVAELESVPQGKDSVTKLLRDSHDSVIIENISPAQSFALFCKTHVDVLAKEIQLLKMKQEDSDELLDAGEVIEKFKKTYKNRYYNFKVNIRAKNLRQRI